MPDFVVEELTADNIALAYPLIRQVAPALDLRHWTRFARQTAEAKRPRASGILVVRRPPRPFPCGMVCYRRDRDPAYHDVLTAEYFVAMDLLDSAGALEALVAELDKAARRLGCGAIRSLLQGADPGVTAGLRAADHVPEGKLLVKVLAHGAEGGTPEPG